MEGERDVPIEAREQASGVTKMPEGFEASPAYGAMTIPGTDNTT